MVRKKPQEFRFSNATFIGRWIAGKLLKHDDENIVPFDQASVVDSLGNHMDQIQKTIRWVLSVTIVISWSTIASETNVKILGLEISRNYVFYFASVYFIFVNTSIFIWFVRIGKLLQHLNNDFFMLGLSRLSVHTFLSNPFVFVGAKSYHRGEAQRGLMLMIGTWWIPNLSLMEMARVTNVSVTNMYIAQGIYLVVGLLSLITILQIWDIVFSKLEQTEDNLLGSDSS